MSPSKFREKLKRKHTRRVLFQYRNCKLKQNVESIFCRTFKVHSKVTFQSRSTEQICLVLKQVWWMHRAIFTVLFTKMWTLKFKSHPRNCFFTAVNHNYNCKQQTLRHRKTQNRLKSPITNHKPWPFEPIKVNFCFPKRSIKMIDGSEKHNQTISIAVQDWCNGVA